VATSFCYLDIPAHLRFNRWDKPPLIVLTKHDEQALQAPRSDQPVYSRIEHASC
jgi:hypothetical protein